MLKKSIMKKLVPIAVLIALLGQGLPDWPFLKAAGASPATDASAVQPAQSEPAPAQPANTQADPAITKPPEQNPERATGQPARVGRRPAVMPRRPPLSEIGAPQDKVQGGASALAVRQQNPMSPNQQAAPVMQSRLAAMSGGNVTLNFDDADVYTIIQTIFGDILHVNYIIDPRIKGRVTFRSVAPVPRDRVLPLMEVVMRLNGIAIVEESGLHRIVPIADIAKEPAPLSIGRDPDKIRPQGKSILQVVPILHISSSEVLRLMTPFLSQNALVVDVPKGNKIIIVDTDANVKRLLRLLDVFDNESVKQKKPKIFVYHCQNGKARDIAATLQQVFLNAKTSSTAPPSYPAGKSGAALPQPPQAPAPSNQPQGPSAPGSPDMLVAESTRIFSDDILNAVMIMATPEDYEVIKETLVKIDIAQRQVMIEGLIAEVTLKDNLDIELSGLLKASIGKFNLDIGLNAINLNIDPTKPTGSGFSLVGTDSSGRVRALVTALATESKAKVLASPHILVSDNREAKIQIGQQVPITTSETYGSVGVAPQRIVQYKDIGIILKVKPRVNHGGLVAMEVGQEVSTFQTIPLGNIGETQIIINKTEADTSLVVQDGQSIVIGGLIREDTSKTRSGIPWLSKIPVLGWLFGSTNDDKQRTELIILLTPHVMSNQADASKVTSGYVDGMIQNSQGRITKDELVKKGQQQEKSK